MDKNLWDLLKRCSNAIWFGYSEGSWIGEEKAEGAKSSMILDRKMMEELAYLGYIERTDITTPSKSGILVVDWRLTSSGRDALSIPPQERPYNT